LALLDARSKDIVVRRYGLATNSSETLDSIGKEYGITRERVRQIEAQAKKLLARRQDVLESIATWMEDLFADQGGILDEDHMMNLISREFVSGPSLAMIRFYLDVLPGYLYVSRSNIFGPHWTNPAQVSGYADKLVDVAEGILKEAGDPINEDVFVNKIREQVGLNQSELSEKIIFALLQASKRLQKTVFDEWGIIDWVETTPRGVSDKAYIVLKRKGDPLHFRDITADINDVQFDNKQAHEQTVHNELIKDDRFVLVGRGLYGLTDWGYIPGTVADVLEAVLAEAATPLTREELLEKVLEQRMVKKTTVLLGLQNSNRFKKVKGNRYSLVA